MLNKIRPLFPYLKRYWKSLVLGGLAAICYNGLRVLIPLIAGRALDDLRLGITHAKLLHHSLLLLLVAALSGVFLYLTRQIIIGVSREIEFDLRNDLFANLTRQSASFYQTHRTGDIMARTTNDLNAVRMLLGPVIMYSANCIFFTLLAIPCMIRYSPRLTFIAFVPLPIASLLIQSFGQRIHRRFERIQAMFSDITAKAQENFSGARLIRAFAQEDAEIASFERANLEYIGRSLHLVRLMAMLWPSLEMVLGLSLVLTLLVGGHEVVAHRISSGDFLGFNIFIVMLTWPMIAVGWVVNIFQRGTASVLRIDELLKQQPTIADDAEVIPLPAITGAIALRNLGFAYLRGGPTVLDDITLDIPAGSSLAIVGPTGSGKSTLVGLIPRLYDVPPDMGGREALLIDGHPIRNYPLAELRAAIGFVPQETFLFSTTIAENIAFGVPDATPAQIESAAATAHIAAEILDFPNGFQTVVGERGITLSGGQKQRIAIARALLRNPRILILDDALASVDTYTEERILTGLRAAMQGRTTIFISHCVSTARNADRIAVLVAGRIAECGTHDELLSLNGYYTTLAEKQQLEEELAVTS